MSMEERSTGRILVILVCVALATFNVPEAGEGEVDLGVLKW